MGIVALAISVISTSCTTTLKETEESPRIENTLQSVSYLKVPDGFDTQELMKVFDALNEAIDSIGYPDAGYQLWLIQEDSSEINYMLEGFWPDQTAYDEIHNHPLYEATGANYEATWDDVENVEYHRFVKP